MAALALITERPKMLENILLTKTINKEGVYLVRLCHNGLWKTIIVDDCFPCNQYRQLAYTQANRYQSYVPLIEKACAKLYGSYADLIGGQTEEGFQLLTGAPCDHIDLNPNDYILDKDITWAKLLSACESQ
jgi:calpain-15